MEPINLEFRPNGLYYQVATILGSGWWGEAGTAIFMPPCSTVSALYVGSPSEGGVSLSVLSQSPKDEAKTAVCKGGIRVESDGGPIRLNRLGELSLSF